jgi:hypothetical protein
LARKEDREEEGCRGWIGEGFKWQGCYSGVTRRRLPKPEREREGERNQGEKKMTGGTRTSVRERGRGRGAGPVRVVAGLVLPGLAEWLALFFCSVTFSIFCF